MGFNSGFKGLITVPTGTIEEIYCNEAMNILKRSVNGIR